MMIIQVLLLIMRQKLLLFTYCRILALFHVHLVLRASKNHVEDRALVQVFKCGILAIKTTRISSASIRLRLCLGHLLKLLLELQAKSDCDFLVVDVLFQLLNCLFDQIDVNLFLSHFKLNKFKLIISSYSARFINIIIYSKVSADIFED